MRKSSRLLSALIMFSGGAAMPAVDAHTLKFALPSFEPRLDPQTMIDARSMQINLQIHRGLFRYLPDGRVEPDLASTYEFSKDKKTLVVRLASAKFSNGQEIRPRHVVNSFARMFAVGSSMAADLGVIVGGLDFVKNSKTEMFGVREVASDSVEFRLKKPSSIIISQLAAPDCAVLPIEEIDSESVRSEKWTPPYGAGPYKIQNLTDSKIRLLKWRPDKFDSESAPKEIEIDLVHETSPLRLIENLNVDTIDNLDVDERSAAELAKKGWSRSVTDMTREYFVILNPNRIQASVRRALSDRVVKAIAAQKMGAGFVPAYGFIPPILGGSIERGQEEKDTATKPLSTKALEIIMVDSWDNREKIANLLKEFWRPAVPKISVSFVSANEWNQAKKEKTYDILVNSRAIDYPDGISILNYFRSGVAGNYYFINDARVDRLLDEATSEFDQGKRIAKYQEIQRKVLAKNIVIPLFFGTNSSGLWGPRVRGVPAHPLGFYLLPLEMVTMK